MRGKRGRTKEMGGKGSGWQGYEEGGGGEGVYVFGGGVRAWSCELRGGGGRGD